jgi:predicted nucleic acid-binding protein
MLLLDTSFVIELERELAGNRVGVARSFLRSRKRVAVAISIITVAEFAEGYVSMNDVEAFLSRFRVIQVSRSIAYKTAALQSHLKQRLGENDAWIAATALAYGADLAGRERAFRRVPQLRYVEI